MQYSPFIYLLQVLIIYSTKYMHLQYQVHVPVPTPGSCHLPHQVHAVSTLHIPDPGILIIYPHKVHAELNLYIPAPGIVIIYLTKYMQYSPFIYLLQV